MTKQTFHSLIAMLLLAFMSSCTSEDTTQTTKEDNTITITGTVGALDNGKDGYTTPITTQKEGTYFALVSISNVGGMDNYVRFDMGDIVTVSGDLWTSGNKKNLTVRKILNVEKGKATLIIHDNTYRGISPGDAITKHKAYIQKDKLKTGEGEFDVYQIKAEQDKGAIGLFYPDPTDETLVGDIVAYVDFAETTEGIHVGSSFAELKQKLPKIKVHGSEIEGRTYARYNNLSYRLDVPNFTNEVDMNKIPATTKILEIVINRPVQ